MRTIIAGVLAVFICAICANSKELKGHVPSAVSKSVYVSHASGSKVLQLSIGLPIRNRADLDKVIEDTYSPGNPNYHKYLTPEEFSEYFAPTAADYEAVVNFAKSKGLTIVTRHANRVVLDVQGTVTAIEGAFNVKLNVYQHPTEPRQFIAPESEPIVDDSLPILDIQGLSDYAIPKMASLRENGIATGVGNNGMLRTGYLGNSTLNGTGQKIGLFEMGGYYACDVSNYCVRESIAKPPISITLLNGCTGKPGSGGIPAGWNTEPALDVEMVCQMAPGISCINVYEGNQANSILAAMSSDTSVKQCSSSWLEAHNATTDALYAQMAAQGQAFFQASGDFGAWIYQGTTNVNLTVVDNPNVTVVGGTSPSFNSQGIITSETGWSLSGGGISATYAIPAYQKGLSTASNGASSTMRNIPDIGMLSLDVYVCEGNGSQGMYNGTSISAPLAACYLAMVNEKAVASKLPTVGWINPSIYRIGRSANYDLFFNDCTVGNNITAAGATASSGKGGGFYCAPGYDLVTGWGSPAPLLMDALLGDTNPALSSLTVVIASSVTNAYPVGARWSVDHSPRLYTNEAAIQVEPTTHTISFSSVPGWFAPAPVTLDFLSSCTVTGQYKPTGPVAVYNALFYADEPVWNECGRLQLTTIKTNFQGELWIGSDVYSIVGLLAKNQGNASIRRSWKPSLGVVFDVTSNSITGAAGSTGWTAALAGSLQGKTTVKTNILNVAGSAIPASLVDVLGAETLVVSLPDGSKTNSAVAEDVNHEIGVYLPFNDYAVIGWVKNNGTNAAGNVVEAEPQRVLALPVNTDAQ